MRTILLLAILVAAGFAAEPRSLLFIGNSLTIYNKLPEMVARLAAAGGEGELVIDRQLAGGASLEKHWKDGKALAKLESRAWTWVVIQGQSTETQQQPASFATHAKLFIDAIVARGAKPVLYLTWARRGELDAQERIDAAYRKAAAEAGALVVPAGPAFKAYRAEHGDASLFVDNRHPTPAGSYLAACCFYGTLFGRSPVGLPGDAARLDPAVAAELQGLAWAAGR